MNPENSIMVTGATGFIGNYLVPKLRKSHSVLSISLRSREIKKLSFSNVSAIIHLAGIAHQKGSVESKLYYEVNRDLTIELAKNAKKNGVKHFIFISTVKVYGENEQNSVFDEYSECRATDPYGKSKREAESQLLQIASPAFKIAIIRPPVVYGPKVKGNIYKLKELIRKAPILPLNGINNKRSMVFVGNLTALISKILNSRAHGIFIAGDKESHSTSELVKEIAQEINANITLIKIPSIIQSIIGFFFPGIRRRLFDSFVISNQNTNKKLDFTPPYSFEEGIKLTVKEETNADT